MARDFRLILTKRRRGSDRSANRHPTKLRLPQGRWLDSDESGWSLVLAGKRKEGWGVPGTEKNTSSKAMG